MKILYGFTHDKYAYILTTQPETLTSSRIVTRLGRICNGDRSFHSYMEIPLICGEYVEAQTANLAHSPVANSVPDKSLFISYTNSQKGSSICNFSMAQIDARFHNVTVFCNYDASNSQLLPSIYGYEKNCTKSEGFPYEQLACGSTKDNRYLLGMSPFKGTHIFDILNS